MKPRYAKHFSRIAVALALGSPGAAFAAACCGGGFAAPALIAGDDRAQMTVSVSHAAVAADVGADQLWRRRDDRLTLEDLRLDGAHVFADRWQVGGSLPVARRVIEGGSSAGLGDASVNLGYEYLPDWTYSRYRPKGLGFVKLTVPTGADAWASGDPLDARGRGFWALGLGTLLTKAFGRVDAFAAAGAHYSFPRLGRTPGAGADLSLGLGYSLRNWRFGGSLASVYENGVGKIERVTTASTSVSYLFADRWAATVTVSDQTLFGSPTNTTLSRGVMLWAQRRWAR